MFIFLWLNPPVSQFVEEKEELIENFVNWIKTSGNWNMIDNLEFGNWIKFPTYQRILEKSITRWWGYINRYVLWIRSLRVCARKFIDSHIQFTTAYFIPISSVHRSWQRDILWRLHKKLRSRSIKYYLIIFLCKIKSSLLTKIFGIRTIWCFK